MTVRQRKTKNIWGTYISKDNLEISVSEVGSPKPNPVHETLYAMGRDVEQEKETQRPGDSIDARVVHRFDKMSYREDLGKLECTCDICQCGDSKICIEKKCRCCTVSE